MKKRKGRDKIFKKWWFWLIIILIIIIFLSNQRIFNKVIYGKLPPNNVICSAGGGGPSIFGWAFIGKDILMKCDCKGKEIHKSGENCWDCDWMECTGEIFYSCYKLNAQAPMPPTYNQDYINKYGKNIKCPPNIWTNESCTDISQCRDVKCRNNSILTCKSEGCVCG